MFFQRSSDYFLENGWGLEVGGLKKKKSGEGERPLVDLSVQERNTTSLD